MKKKIKSKFVSAILLGFLAISGGVLALPLLNADNQLMPVQENARLLGQNPERFLQTENLGLKERFQYPQEQSVGETNNAVNEGALEAAIEEGNYEAYKEALQEINGFSKKGSIIDKEDFEVLVALNKSKSIPESEKTE